MTTNPPCPKHVLLKPPELAAYFQVSMSWVKRALADQSLTVYKVGGQNRFDQADADRYLAENRVLSRDDEAQDGAASGQTARAAGFQRDETIVKARRPRKGVSR